MDIIFDKNKRTVKMAFTETNLYDFFETRGFYFPKEVLTRYFLALKTKPFVILTGISGTGKTKIAQVFAEYMCQNDSDEKRVAFLSVRPDWMDNRGLIGYYNLLDGRYYCTSLLRLILEAQKHPQKPFFVILDEMNLAKVEQYFSDFLSIMESRTPDNQQGEPIITHVLEGVETRDHLQIPSKIYIPSNIYFTGTVNVDESTYMFSPKVLDRANVIEFNEVNLSEYIEGASSHDKFILLEPDIRDKLISPQMSPFCSIKDYKRLLEFNLSDDDPISDLLTILKNYNLHFGYRVVNEISRFIIFASQMTHNFQFNDAIDIQILQKILPKLHGTQAKLEQPLEDILSFCYSQTIKVSDDTRQKAKEYDQEARFPRSAQKISWMLRNLKVQGYTSFIE